ncbi:hypothetical protein D3C71_1184900 [compost metagenome]
MQENSIHIILADYEPKDGQVIGVVDKEVVEELTSLAREREKMHRIAEKLRNKNDQALRHANRLMLRIIKSHGIKYNEKTEAVGISNSDLIYVGPKERIKKNAIAEPQSTDKVKATLTKPERRKYDELLGNYEFINKRIIDHNSAVQANEAKLISFEQSILVDKEYNREKQELIVATTGRVFLCDI